MDAPDRQRRPGLAPGHRLGRIADHQDPGGPEEDADVEPEGSMLDVVKVVAHLFRLFLEVVGVSEAYLRPAREAGPDGGAQGIVGNAGVNRS